MKRLRRLTRQAMAAAESLTGKRFALLVASSLAVTTAVVATGLSSAGGSGPLAALLGESLASNSAPAAPAQSGSGEASPLSPGSTGGGVGDPTSPAPTPVALPGPSPAPAADTQAEKTDAPEPTGAPEPSGPVGPIKHVVVISLTSPGYEQSLGAASQMPYLSGTLVPKGQLVPGYTLLSANSLPNDIALLSGQRPNPSTKSNCAVYSSFPTSVQPDKRGLVHGSGCIYPVEVLTLADQVSGARMAWRAYLEGMADESGPHNCVQPQPDEPDVPAPGGYAARLNPFLYFHSLLDVGDCAINDLPIDRLAKDLRKPASTPDFAFIAPNLCNSGLTGQCPPDAPGGAAAADGFLSRWVPKLLSSKAIEREGMIVIAFNGLSSPEAATAPAAGSDPLEVGALLISRYVTAGGTREGSFTPYSLLRTIEDLFALTPLAEAGAKSTKSLGSDLLGPEY